MPEVKTPQVLEHCHAFLYKGHHDGKRMVHKVLQPGFFCPSLSKFAINFQELCDACHKIETILKGHRMPLSNILELKIFDVGG